MCPTSSCFDTACLPVSAATVQMSPIVLSPPQTPGTNKSGDKRPSVIVRNSSTTERFQRAGAQQDVVLAEASPRAQAKSALPVSDEFLGEQPDDVIPALHSEASQQDQVASQPSSRRSTGEQRRVHSAHNSRAHSRRSTGDIGQLQHSDSVGHGIGVPASSSTVAESVEEQHSAAEATAGLADDNVNVLKVRSAAAGMTDGSASMEESH